ncbi:ribosome maturation factor RimM [Alicyclobacillus sp. SO9]|uniref:ribosome maturation factor RimM n=1 Tax=Alicyclobacillus sp. SO9 TaxID=2665646 RepID=UPI0018E7FF6E|nr:ribosome maturation factor RimM [Alicyclobacillus sp. SO9]QQE80771.1 ribosome maturation factor RimM [Alicyclobacillus sp. SO9]
MELDYVTVGSIVNTHGLRGEVRVISKTEIPNERFARGSEMYLQGEDGRITDKLQVASSRPHKQFWLVTFVGMETVQAAERLKGMDLCIHVSELPELEPGNYYIHELIGLSVVSDEGETLGVIKEVLTPGANDVYVVSQPGQKDLLVPALKECILKVDRDKKEMTVHLLPGLREMNQ